MSVSHGLLHRIWLGIEQRDEKFFQTWQVKKRVRCVHKNFTKIISTPY